MSRDLFRAACDRSVTHFMIRYLEKRGRTEIIRAYNLFYPDRRAGDDKADGAEAAV